MTSLFGEVVDQSVKAVDMSVRGTNRVVEEDAGQSVAGMTLSLGSDPLVKARIVQLYQEAAVSVWTRRTNAKRMSIRLGHYNDRDSLSVSVEKDAKLVLEVAAERMISHHG